MAAPMPPEEQFALITSSLQETLNPEIIKKVLEEKQRPLAIYWGTATTGKPHCGYFVPLMKIAEFLRAGCSVKVLLADIHGFLDNLKAPIELVNHRAQYYRFMIRSLLKAIKVPIDRLEFVLGSDYQLTPKYTMDLFRLSSVVTEHDAKKAGAEVVKQVDNATLSGLIYPLMQSLDEQYLDVDAQFGGVDQRKIFALAKEVLPRIGYRERAHLMNPMVPGLTGGKMSSSEPDSKIDPLDPPDVVKRKVKKAFAEPRKTEGNGLLSFIEYVLLPASALNGAKANFTVERRDAEPLHYSDIKEIHKDYENDTLTPQLLKAGLTDALVKLLEPVQAEYAASEEWQRLSEQAYPSLDPKKKEKKKKDKGSRYPGGGAGGKEVEAKPDGHVEGKDAERVNVGTDATHALKKLSVKEDGTPAS